MQIQWAHSVFLIGLWIWTGRSWSELGLGLDVDLGFVVTAGVVALLLVQLYLQIAKLRRDPELSKRALERSSQVIPLFPRTKEERSLFDALSFTAGVCEELAYRGFLFWYLGTWMPIWAALLVAALAFGCAHLYEGVLAALVVVLLAVIAGGLYLASGSLWIPMVMHAAFDMVQLRMLSAALESSPLPCQAIDVPGESSP